MTDLSAYMKMKREKHRIADTKFELEFTSFMANNSWFGGSPIIKNKRVFLDDDVIKNFEYRIDDFCKYYNASNKARRRFLDEKLKNLFPETRKIFNKWCKSKSLDDDVICVLLDFLLYYLPGELLLASDDELEYVMRDANHDLAKVHADLFAEWINWTGEKYKTIYKQRYYFEKRSSGEEATEAYDPHKYLKMVYHMFNPGYIEENDMYLKAAESKNYIDTWLFLSIHFICAIRNTDLISLPSPRLPMTAREVLDKVALGTFAPESAEAVLQSFEVAVEAYGKSPNKTKRMQGIGEIKLFVPESVRIHFGTLLAIAEAHRRLSADPQKKKLIRIISTYEDITRYMGEEIGNLFLESNFRSISANKSFMQMIELLTNDIVNGNEEFNVKGYILAALARSHKGSYAQFAETTSTYLRDAKMNGYTPEFVAREMMERGVLSLTMVMLLRMITDGEYQHAPVETQTRMIQVLNMSPVEIERTVDIMQQLKKQSMELAAKIYNCHTKNEILELLHNVANGNAVSKQGFCLCIITGMKKICPFDDRKSCPGCENEISTKATMYMMIAEQDRLMSLYNSTTDIQQKKRYKTILMDVVLPSIDRMLQCMEELYGHQSVESLEKIIIEYKNGK